MVGSTGTLMTMRLVRSKLRKREETTSASPATNIEAQTTTFANNNHYSQQHHQQHNNYHHNNHRNSTSSQCSNSSSQNQQMFSTSSSTTSFEANHNQNNAYMNNNNLQSTINSNGNCNGTTTVTFVRQSPAPTDWVFPPKAPTPNIYNCSNNFDAIVNANDKHGFKGFRKQFSGRFKRLVAKKPAEPAPAIPPELKPQLKTIFVY